MPVAEPGAGSVGTATDRLAASIRRMAGGSDVLAASAVIYLEEEDGTTVELYPDPVPDEGEETPPDEQPFQASAPMQSLGVSHA